MTKDLTEKAIDFKGKKYVLVSDRVIFFNETYPDGSITTELVSTPEAETVIIKATVKPNDKQTFTGYSQATWGNGYINKTSALENAETSAVGRALAFMGIGVIDSIASVDEINKATDEPTYIKDEQAFVGNEFAKKQPTTTTKQPNNVKVSENNQTALKSQIKALCDEMSKAPIKTAIEYRNLVKQKTEMELTEENYEEIINRLKIIKEEQK